MKQKLMIVKHEAEELKLLRDLHLASHELTQSRGKSLAWLQFATKQGSGVYRFHNSSDIQWEVLEKIVAVMSKSYPNIPTGKLTDLLSRLVNTTIQDVLQENGKKPHRRSLQHSVHGKEIQTTLIHFTNHPIYLPRHPWIRAVEKIHKTKDEWITHDISTGKGYFIRKNEKDGYVHFLISLLVP